MAREVRPYNSWELRSLLNRLQAEFGIKTEEERADFMGRAVSAYRELLSRRGLPGAQVSSELEAFVVDLKSYLRRNPLPDPDAERKVEMERRARGLRSRVWLGVGVAVIFGFWAFGLPALRRFHHQITGDVSPNYVENDDDALLRRSLAASGAYIPVFGFPRLQFGLLFGLGSKDDVPAVVGWCPPEASGVWSCGREAVLAFKIADFPRDARPVDFVIRIDGSFFRSSRYSILGRQAISSEVARSDIHFSGPLSFFLEGDLVVMKMLFPDARSPVSVGLNDVDDRLLGLSIASLSVEAVRR